MSRLIELCDLGLMVAVSRSTWPTLDLPAEPVAVTTAVVTVVVVTVAATSVVATRVTTRVATTVATAVATKCSFLYTSNT